MSRNYRIDLSYFIDNWLPDDQKYEKMVGRSSDGSGMGCGERDLSWDLSSKKRALSVFDKLTSGRDRNLTRVTLSMHNDD